MVIGVITWDLHVAGCQSLKDKRRVIKSLKDRLRNKYNLSVAETGARDTWQRGELSCCVVSSDRTHAESVLQHADNLVAGDSLARIIDSRVDFL